MAAILVLIYLLVSACFTFEITRSVARQLQLQDYTALPYYACMAVILYYPLFFWCLIGMETGLVTVLLLAAVVAVLRCQERRSAHWLYIAAAVMGLCYLTRPDTALFAVPIVVYGASSLWRRSQVMRSMFISSTALVIIALFAVAHITFRLEYYGHSLPNTYILKMTGMPIAVRLLKRWT